MVRELRGKTEERMEPVVGVIEDSSGESDQAPMESGRWLGSLPPARDELLGRVAFLAVAAYAFAAGMRIYDGAGIWDPAMIVGLALYVGALTSLLAAFLIREPTRIRSQSFLAAVVLLALVGSVAFEINTNPVYGTDSLAITHVAGELLLEGENPYAVVGEPLGPIIDRFGVPHTFVTQTTTGEAIDRLVVYPGGHVLAYTGALALGVDDLRWATLGFEIVALGVIWWVLSPSARLLVPLVLLVEPNLTIHFTAGGVTDWLWVLPVSMAAVMLHRRQWGYAGFALGIACAIKHQPWFAVPFVLVWAYMQIRRERDRTPVHRDLGALVLGSIAGFAVLNLPFIVWGPQSWLQGTLSPLLDRLVPDGQGFSLLASRGFLPLPQIAFSIAMGATLLVALFVYYRRFDRMKNLLWVLPPMVLLFSHRSLHNYFIFWIPIAALWLDLEGTPTWRPISGSPAGSPERRRGRSVVAVVAGSLIVLAAGIGFLLASGDPIEVGAVDAQVEAGMVTALDVEVTNTGRDSVTPVFSVYWGRYPVPWDVVNPEAIEPGETEVLRIVPGTQGVMPPLAINSDGLRQPEAFRVRVNDRGTSTYSSSALVVLDPVSDAVINTSLSYWGQVGGTTEESPFGWLGARRSPSGTSSHIRTLGSGRGASLAVSKADAEASDWVEAGLVQDVAAVASCYRVVLSTTHPYLADQEGRPLAATGLQIQQGGSSLWFVLSETQEVRTNVLPEGTRIVEIPATVGVMEAVQFDLASLERQAGIETGRAGTIKLFSAFNGIESTPQELRVSSVTECRA